MEDETHFTALEIKIAYLEDFTAQLQNTVLEYSREIDALKRENLRLKARMDDIASSFESMPQNRPPHY